MIEKILTNIEEIGLVAKRTFLNASDDESVVLMTRVAPTK